MRTPVSSLSLLRPRTLHDALVMLRDEGPVTPIAGCTDVYVGLQFGTLPRPPLHRSVADRRTARDSRDAFDPAHRRADDVLRADRVADRSAEVADARCGGREVGGRQIQNRGTLGGNIANASPAGDSLPVLAAANATIVLQSADAERRVPFTAFYTGYRASVRRADELIAAIEIPRVDGKQYLAQGGNAPGAGDLEGHVRGRPRARWSPSPLAVSRRR